jgi:hypothetical protein
MYFLCSGPKPRGSVKPVAGGLMHLHENPKGLGRKIVTAEQPCKIGESNLGKVACNFAECHTG